MSGEGMPRSGFGNKQQDCPLLTPIIKRVSIGELVHHPQRALLNSDTSDCGFTAVVGLLPLFSLFQRGLHSGAAKG